MVLVYHGIREVKKYLYISPNRDGLAIAAIWLYSRYRVALYG